MAGAVNVQVTIDARDEGAAEQLLKLKQIASELGLQFNAATKEAQGLGLSIGSLGRDLSGAFAGAIEGATGLRTVLFQVALAYEAVHAASAFLKEGFAATNTLEQARLGIAGEIVASATIRDSTGKALDGQAKFAAATAEADKQMQALRQDASRVGIEATTLVDIFTKSVAPALRGGGNLDSLREETTKLAVLAQELNVPYTTLSATLLQILNGHVQQRNQLVAILGISNEELKTASERGKIQDLLNAKLAKFGDLAEHQSSTLALIGGKLKAGLEEQAVSAVEPFVREIEQKVGPALQHLDLSGISSSLHDLSSLTARLFGEAFDKAVAGAQELSGWLKTHKTEVDETLGVAGDLAREIGAIAADVLSGATSLAEWVTSSGLLRGTMEFVAASFREIREDAEAIARGARESIGPGPGSSIFANLIPGGATFVQAMAEFRAFHDRAQADLQASITAARAQAGNLIGPISTPTSFATLIGDTKVTGDKTPAPPDKSAARKALQQATEEEQAAIRLISEQEKIATQQAEDDHKRGILDLKAYYIARARIEYDALQQEIDVKEVLLAKEKDPGKRAILLSEIEIDQAKQLEATRHFTAEYQLEAAKRAKADETAARAGLTEQGASIRDTLAAKVADVHAQVDVGTITKVEGAKQLADAYREALGQLLLLIDATKKLAVSTGDPKLSLEVLKLQTEYSRITVEAKKATESSNDFAKTLSQAVGKSFDQAFGGGLDHVRTGLQAIREVIAALIADIQRGIADPLGKRLASALLGFLGGGGGLSIGSDIPTPDLSSVTSLLPGAASGGYVTGPGTSTSDSIPARLSAGEYVLPALAVRRLGGPSAVARMAGGGYVSSGGGDSHHSIELRVHHDPSVILEVMGSSQGQKLTVHTLHTNQKAASAVLGINRQGVPRV